MKKLAAIIGAGAGLGFAAAKNFALEGFKVILMARNEDSLLSMCNALRVFWTSLQRHDNFAI